MKLKSKLLLLLVGVIILPLVIGIGFTYYDVNNSISSIDMDRAEANLASAKEYINLLVKNHASSHSGWTLWTEYYDAIESKDIAWIEENIFPTVEEDTANEVVVVLNRDGSILAEANAPKDWKSADFSNFNMFKKLTAGSQRYVGGIEKTSDGLYLTTIVKVVTSEDDKFESYNGYTLYARKFKNAHQNDDDKEIEGIMDDGKSVMNNVDIAIKLDDKLEGENIFYTNKNLEIGTVASKDFKGNEIKAYSNRVNDTMKIKTQQVFNDFSGKPIGILHVETTTRSGVAALNKLARDSSILAIGLLVFLLISVTLLIINVVLKPLNLILKEVQKIADGDLRVDQHGTVLINKYAKKKDEIGQFARAFESMRSNLRLIIGSVSESVSQVTDTSNTLSEIALQTGDTSEQVARAVDEMSEGASKQSEYAGMILRMVEQTQEQVQAGSIEIEKTVSNALASTKVAYEGKGAINQAIEHVKVTARTVSSSTESIQKLGTRSEEIGGIITAISDISNQTNLLALNAAIEAARAGEHGKGFSVVADEIRKLAEQTRHEAKQITDLIKDIQNETYSTVENMQNNMGAVENQVDMIQKGGEALSVIVNNVERTEDDSKKIQDIFGSLKQFTDEVLHNIKEISNIIVESAASSEEVAASAQEQASTVNNIAGSAKDLAQLASKLKSEMNKFKI
ncbi:MAG: methyl-accepting chemotaxis protein [Clostridia bacterium]|nr:methyl-accepting chemotaxis protein [Clostridia bacterium]